MRRRWLIGVFIPVLMLGGLLWLAGQEWTLRWVAQKIVQANDNDIQIEGVSGTLFSSLEIEKISLDSVERNIRINHLTFEWNPWSLLQGQLDVSQILADSVSVDLKQSSREPFVLPRSLAPPVSIRISDVRFDSVSITRSGVGVTLRNVNFSLVADTTTWRLKDLGFDSSFGNAGINVSLGTVYPYPVDGTIRFDNEWAKAEVDMTLSGNLGRLGVSGNLDGYGAKGRLDAIVTPFAAFPAETVHLNVKGLDPSKIEPAWPVACFDAQMDVRAGTDQTLTGNVAIRNGKPGPFNRNEIPVRFMKGTISGYVDNVLLDDILLDFGKAGRFTGNGRLASGKTEFALATSRFDLHEISSSIRSTHISGKVRFFQWGNDQDFRIEMGENHIRLNARLLKKGNELDLEAMSLKAGRGEFRMTGHMNLEEDQFFKLAGEVNRFNFASFGQFPESDLNFRLDISGSLKPQRNILVRYSFLPSRLFGQEMAGQGQFHVAEDGINDVDVLLALGTNSISMSGNLGKRGDKLVWKLEAPDLAALGKGYKGVLSGEGELNGSLDSMRVLMDLDGTDFMVLDRYGAGKLQARLHFGTGLEDGIAVDALLEEVTIGTGTWKMIQAGIDGTLRSHTIQVTAENDVFDLVVRASGGFTSKRIWEGRLDILENRGEHPFVLSSSVPVRIGRDEVSLRNMTLKLPKGQLAVERLIKRDDSLETSGYARGVPLTYLLAVSPGFDDTVSSTLTLGAEWSLAAGRSLDGRIHLYREQGDIALLGDSRVELGLDTLDVQTVFSRNTADFDARIESTKAGTVQIQAMTKFVLHDGSWGISKESPFKLSVQADIPSIAWIGPLTGQQDMELDGAVSLQVNGNGTWGNPRLSGSVDGTNLSLNWLNMGVNLSRGEISAKLDGNHIWIANGIIYGPEGQLQIGGGIRLKNGQLRGDLDFRADKLQVLSNVDRQLAITGKGNLSLDENRLRLSGEWYVNRAMIILNDSRNVTYSKDVVVLGRPEKKNDNPVPLEFSLKVGLGNKFYLKGKGLDTRLAGQIQVVSGQDNRLRVFGTVNTEDGSYTAFGQKLTIKKGLVAFSGPVENPVINILAVREFPPTDDVTEVGVSVKGTAQSPKVRLVSTPEVSDTEKLSWLVLGYSGGENGDEQQRALIATAAAAILSTEQSGGLPTRLASTIGLDDIGISSSSQLDETVLSLTKRISSRLYLTYEQGLTGATNLIKLRYIISRRLSLVGQTGTITAVDLLYDWKFD